MRCNSVIGVVLTLLVVLPGSMLPAEARKKIPQQTEEPAQWHPYDCPWDAAIDRHVDCGVLEVAENRAQQDSRSIYLHVRIFRAEQDADGPPVVFLNGGPGQSMNFSDAAGLEFWEYYLDFVMRWARNRDVVLFAQRGITVDGVGMICERFGDPRVFLGATERPGPPTDWIENVERVNRDCLSELASQGYDLPVYTTTESARDVEALRKALGIDSWLLYGVSYGTRLGLEVMRQDPAGVAAAIFDSVFPPQTVRHWHDPQPFVDAMDAFFAACAADRRCDNAYPTLEADFDASLARLRSDPFPIFVDDPENRMPRLHFVMDDIALLDMVFFNLYWINGIERLPKGLDALARNDISEFREILAQPYVFDPLFSDWSYGMQAAMNCNDDFAWYEEASLRDAIETHPRLQNWLGTALLVPACQGWPNRPRRSGFSDPVVSDIPTLMLVGRHDPVTPPAYARTALESLSRGQLHIVPGASHSVMDAAACARALATRFVANPQRQLPRLCAERDPGFNFTLR